ncbi:uncharacterized protein K452DRAFT_270059 [Aplosporella prunicola CBS 121167]|uniref:Blue (type 1) copper domain-containing protein n=1 Tax=Aplosporella prunicola CBS 121167 TaxID=1176127 RepID=A0A6A6BHU2_9PEZI|nr:uncharacterized protein K452DRAFT_270059 [Aplosporella prunicola CBS 121167]KAF2142417.1 hypothetical protein K452DRAFT_270059 [Aplosporella prunicola CBS 121167]
MRTYELFTLFAAGAAAQMTHTVTVGGVMPPPEPSGTPTPMLVYNPENVQAAVGDMVEFKFMEMNHTVTQSSFDNPCVKAEDGFDSGFMPNPDGKDGVTWSVMVNDTKPVWAYCKKGPHCGLGMVFSINAAMEGDKTFEAFKDLAMKINGTDMMTVATPDMLTPAGAAATPQMASVAAASVAETPAAAASASTVPGMGFAADGGACDCSCLCGANSFPEGAAMNNYGGVAGKFF